MDYHVLPPVNATLNFIAACLLMWGLILIKSGKRDAHRRVMLSAFGVSVVFLICYLVYHYGAGHVVFQKTGWISTVYHTILITHIILAFTVPVLALITLNHALRGRFDKHRKIAKWTWPIWMYVSVTGVIVYLMLYQM